MNILTQRLLNVLFPPKCVLCRRILSQQQTHLCPKCRASAPKAQGLKRQVKYIKDHTTLWHYEDNVRKSIHRYKFGGQRSYVRAYGPLLAMQILQDIPQFDVLTWVPISARRRRQRGYDQVELLAQEVARELGITALPVLRKIRHNKPQSSIHGQAQRRANVLGAYAITGDVAGKTILLLDDVLTTGATLSECARMLQEAGARRVYAATIAATRHDRK
jgi:ComF family protein